MIQRKLLIYSVAVLALLTASCGGRRHSQEYYEQMIDSIRKAEQVKEIERKAGIGVSHDPVGAWLDSLPLRTLPIRNAGDDLVQLGDFVQASPRRPAGSRDARLHHAHAVYLHHGQEAQSHRPAVHL